MLPLQALYPRMALGQGRRVLLSALPAARLAPPLSALPSLVAAASTRQLSVSSGSLAKLTPSAIGASAPRLEQHSSKCGASIASGPAGIRSYSSAADVASLSTLKAGDTYEGKTTSAMFAIKTRLAGFPGAREKVVPPEVVSSCDFNDAMKN